MKKFIRTIGLAAVIFSAVSVFASEGWLTDFEKAKKEAKKDNLLILADFSGSDWCGWCKKLDAEVFSKKEFKDFAKKNFVLLLIDFPSKKKLPAKEVKQNQALAKKYGIRGYPTVLILDSKGKILEKTGYQSGGAANYIKYLKGVIDKNKK